jgi:hypothetical protein
LGISIYHFLLVSPDLTANLLQTHAIIQLLDCLLQVFETQNEYSDVVERSASRSHAKPNLDALRCGNVLIVMEILLSAGTLNSSLLLLSVIVGSEDIRLALGGLLSNAIPH